MKIFSVFFLSSVFASNDFIDGKRNKDDVSIVEITNDKSDIEFECVEEFKQNEPEGQLKSPFQKNYNIIHQIINDNEYLIMPLSGAVAGGIRWGSWGLILGGTLGLVDMVLDSFGCTDGYYLTWGIFGIAAGNTIKPSVMSDIAGVTVGILLPTGLLNDKKELVAPVISAIATRSRMKKTGIVGFMSVVGGGVLGIVDDFFIHNGVTDKHYLTFCITGVSLANLHEWLNSMPVAADSIGVILGLIVANYEDEIVKTWSPIELTEDLYAVYSKFLPKEYLASHVEKQALALVGSQFIIQYLDLKLIEYQQGLFYNFERLDIPNSPAWKRFQPKLLGFAVFVFPYIAGRTFSELINEYFSTKLHFALEDEVRAKWLADETALRLSQGDDTSVLIDNMRADVLAIADSGSKLITDTISSTIKGMYGFGIVIVGAPDIMIYSVIYNQACTSFSEYLARKQRDCEEQIKVQESKITNIIKHDNKNFRLITERDGLEFTQRKLQECYDDLREHEVGKEIWKSAMNIWRSLSGVTDFMLNI